MPRSLLNFNPSDTPSDSGGLQFRPTPEASPEQEHKRIVHIGLGAFARAHIAVLTQIANNAANEQWHMSGIVRSNQSLPNILAKQNYRYVVAEIAEQAQGQIIDCIDEVLSWQQDYPAILQRLTDPATKLVTVTVTEKGYCLDARGELSLDNADVQQDLSQSLRADSTCNTLPGLLCQTAWHRMQQGVPGFIIISCDNVSRNGESLKSALLQFSGRLDKQLNIWIDQHLHCPNTVVDCIVPRISTEQIEKVQSTFDIDDEVPVLCEPFRQWVIAGVAMQDAPRWELAGAELVADSSAYEDRKLRILNAAHSALAYLGLLQNCRWVCEAIAQQSIRDQLDRLMEEVFRSLSDQNSARLYYLSVVKRFENTAMQHALTQIGSDGSSKIPLRWVPSIISNQQHGSDCGAFSKVIAAWLACWHVLPQEHIAEMTDPEQAKIKQLASQLSQQFSQAQWDSALWLQLLGFEANAAMQQQVQAAFIEFTQDRADVS